MQSLARGGYTAEEVRQALLANNSWSFRYELLNSSNNHRFWLESVLGGRVDNNSDAEVKRTAKFVMRDDSSIDWFSNRIRPWARLRMPDTLKTVLLDTGPKPYADVVLESGPVGWWRLGEASGTVAVDSSGNGLDGEYVGPWTHGESGALVADDDTAARNGGSGQGHLIFPTATYRAVEFWINRDQYVGAEDWEYLLDARDEMANGWIALDATGANSTGSGWAEMYVNAVLGPVEATRTPVGEWAHVVVIGAADTPPGDIHLLARYSNQQEMGAALDEVALYDRALTADEIKRHYDAGRGRVRTSVEEVVPVEQWAEWPLGIFILSSPERAHEEGDTIVRQVEAYDQLAILAEDRFVNRYTLDAGLNVVQEVKTILTNAGVTNHNISASTHQLVGPEEWPPGTKKIDAINYLLRLINFEDLWFGPAGSARARPYVTPQDRPSEFDYETNDQSIITPGTTETFDAFEVPNQWVVAVSEPDRDDLVSTYTNDNPDSPTSTVSRGRTITHHERGDNAATQADLDERVLRMAFEASQVYQTVKLTTGLIPAHDNLDVVKLVYNRLGLDAKFVQHKYSFDLSAETFMTHELKRVVQI